MQKESFLACALNFDVVRPNGEQHPWRETGCRPALDTFTALVEQIYTGPGLGEAPLMLTTAIGCCIRTVINIPPARVSGNPTDAYGNSSNSTVGGGDENQVFGIERATDVAGKVVEWALRNKVCGREASVVIIVGADSALEAPKLKSYFGCNPGPTGFRLPFMCRC
ncbi:hypothetical protein FOA52_010450 [Chlamydomonas sp. UWO 241]|nr:hypothetical protein FOA52_010450 [Chlamydomonas sp. UWO 241]